VDGAPDRRELVVQRSRLADCRQRGLERRAAPAREDTAASAHEDREGQDADGDDGELRDDGTAPPATRAGAPDRSARTCCSAAMASSFMDRSTACWLNFAHSKRSVRRRSEDGPTLRSLRIRATYSRGA